ncbi:hypothetical protein BHM03_00055857 [Ensete ventricosum]|nr:hypothetical protein BHM03_00055857 [Ensete ventricosum]
MRLNHVESFYAFLLRFRSEDNEEEGQPGMARPFAKGAVGCGQAPCKGRSPAGATAARRHDRLRPARKGLPPAGAVAPTARVAAPCQGDCCPQRATATCAGQWRQWPYVGGGDGAKGTKGLGHPFKKRMILPL